MDSLERYSYKPSLKWNPKVEEYFVQAYGEDHFSRISDAHTGMNLSSRTLCLLSSAPFPKAYDFETIVSLRNHAMYQRRMLDKPVQLVRPGRVIVYSTCTINPGENEDLV